MSWLVIGALIGCGKPKCSDCEDAEICVEHRLADDSVEFVQCASVPPACQGGLDCASNACVVEAYEQCDAGYQGAFCDDEASPEEPSLVCYEE